VQLASLLKQGAALHRGRRGTPTRRIAIRRWSTKTMPCLVSLLRPGSRYSWGTPW